MVPIPKVSNFLASLTLCILGNFACFCHLLTFLKINFFDKLFQEHNQSVKGLGSRSGQTFSLSCSGSKLFAKVIKRCQKSISANKELKCHRNLKSGNTRHL